MKISPPVFDPRAPPAVERGQRGRWAGPVPRNPGPEEAVRASRWALCPSGRFRPSNQKADKNEKALHIIDT